MAAADIVADSVKETLDMVRNMGNEGIAITCDVTDPTQVRKMVDETFSKYGRLDCGVNNAGIAGDMAPLVDYPFEVWNKVISINLTGIWLCMKYEVEKMLKNGKGSIVNMASVSGLIGTPGISAYTASKHGVIGLTKNTALEYATAGIRVNAVCPAAIQSTNMFDVVLADHPEMKEYFMDTHPIGRFGDPSEVAEAIIWLCSDAASFVTGSTMTIDGGLTAR